MNIIHIFYQANRLFTTSAGAAGNLVATGWFETITATISGVNDADVKGVSYSGPTSGSLTGDDLKTLSERRMESSVSTSPALRQVHTR